MLFKDDKPPTSKEEAVERRVRPPPGKYDPDKRSHWSITMMLAWIIWGEIDAVRNEWDDYRNGCADWVFENDPIARAQIGQIGPQKGSWHLHQWPRSGWNRLYLRAISKNILEPRQQAILPPQVAKDELWLTAGEGRIKATALECKNARAFDGNHVEIPAHHWAHLKLTDDRSTGKPMLSGPDRVYREVQFPRLDAKELWPKSPPPLSGEHAETGPSHLALIQLIESTTWNGPFHRSEVDALEHVEKPEPEQTRPAEPELLEKKARPAPESKQSKRAERYIQKHFPDGTDGVSTTEIHRKFTKDKDLQAELEKEDGAWGVPSPAVINRVLGRRK